MRRTRSHESGSVRPGRLWKSARAGGLALAATLATLSVGARASADGALTQVAGTDGCTSDGGSGGNCADGTALEDAQGLAVTRNGVSLYVAGAGSDGVASFLRHPSTGALTQLPGTNACVTETGSGGLCSDGKALLGARDLALSANGKSLYVAAPGSDAIAIFDRDPSTGNLFQLTGTGGCISETGSGGTCINGAVLEGARSLVITANAKNLYVVSRDSDAVVAFSRDKQTGALTQLEGPGACVSENGSGGLCANGIGLDFPTSLAVTADGRNVYVASSGSSAVTAFARDKATGTLTQLEGTAGCISEDGTGGQCTVGRGLLGAFAVAASEDGRNVYVAARDGNAITSFARDKTTGALTQLPGTSGCVSELGIVGTCADGKALLGVAGITVPRDGKNVYATSETSDAVVAFARDKRTGILTQLAGTEGCVSEDGTLGTCADGKALIETRNVIVARNGRHAYVASSTSDAVAVFNRE